MMPVFIRTRRWLITLIIGGVLSVMACATLAQTPDKPAPAAEKTEMQELLQMLAGREWKTSEAREAVLELLAKNRGGLDAAFKPLLLNSLKDPKPSVRLKALDIVREAKLPDMTDPVIALLKDENRQVRRQAVATLSRLGGAASTGTLLNLLADTDPDIRQAAAYSLLSARQEIPTDSLLSLMKLKDPQMKVMVLDFGVNSNPKQFAPVIKAALADESPQVRARALRLVTQTHSEGITAAEVRPLTGDPDAVVRAAAVMTLAGLKSPDTLAVLQKLSKDDSPLVRQNVAMASSGLPFESAFPLLKTLAADPAAEVRQVAVRQFISMPAVKEHPAEVTPLLLAAVKDSVSPVATAGLQGLMYIGAKEGPGAVVDAYNGGDNSTRANLMYFVSQLPDPQRQNILSAAIKDKDANVRLAVVKNLRNIPAESGLELAKQAGGDSEPSVRRSVVFFLESRQNDGGAQELLKKLQNDAEPSVAEAARRALARAAERPAPRPNN